MFIFKNIQLGENGELFWNIFKCFYDLKIVMNELNLEHSECELGKWKNSDNRFERKYFAFLVAKVS